MIRQSPRAWIVLCLSLSVTSCGTAVEVVDSSPFRPPATLLRDCPHPERDPATLRDMVDLVLDYTSALDACNGDKAALRQLYEDLER